MMTMTCSSSWKNTTSKGWRMTIRMDSFYNLPPWSTSKTNKPNSSNTKTNKNKLTEKPQKTVKSGTTSIQNCWILYPQFLKMWSRPGMKSWEIYSIAMPMLMNKGYRVMLVSIEPQNITMRRSLLKLSDYFSFCLFYFDFFCLNLYEIYWWDDY